ncbi:MAG TPA: thiamine pyrophosphate-binding protein [Mycobacteriales bacterium]|nr:thiamine pyrophosphate-binding protein [Mycobacteriales bacterium]
MFARQLVREGVDTIFTLTGGHISPLLDGCVRAGVRVVDVRHEQAAAHAADAYARLTRNVGVAVVTAGPGLTGVVTAVANAHSAGSPLVVVAGRNPLALEGAGALQEAPHADLLKPVTKRTDVAFDAWRIGELLHWACATATAPRCGPAFLDLPLDVQLTPVDPARIVVPSDRRTVAAAGVDPGVTDAAVKLLSAASTPVILVGTGAYWADAGPELAAVAEAMNAPVFLNGMARGLLPTTHPCVGALARSWALERADSVLLVGGDFDFRLGYGRSGLREDVAVIQVDPQADRIGHNRAVTHGVVGDVRAFLGAVADASGAGRTDKTWLAEVRAEELSREHKRLPLLRSEQVPIHPLRLATEVARFADDDAVFVGDGGDVVTAAASVVRANVPGHWMDPGPFGCLGIGAPFAMAARLARPGHQVVALFGDGSFGFNGFEYDSAVRQSLPFVGVIGNDGAWGEMKAFHRDLFGEEHLVAQDLSRATRYDLVVEALGGYGERVTEPAEIAPALRRAADSGVPAVVDVHVAPRQQPRHHTSEG